MGRILARQSSQVRVGLVEIRQFRFGIGRWVAAWQVPVRFGSLRQSSLGMLVSVALHFGLFWLGSPVRAWWLRFGIIWRVKAVESSFG